ncbi:hypothetical protein A2U01_0004398, partial [Trifolium medium]|nr:hypothetical protein [Trifolium medium]
MDLDWEDSVVWDPSLWYDRVTNRQATQNGGVKCSIILSNHKNHLEVLVTGSPKDLNDWIKDYNNFNPPSYPLPCGFAFASTDANNSPNSADTIHLCGVQPWPLIYQIDKNKGIPENLRKFLNEQPLFPTFNYRHMFNPVEVGNKIFLREYIPEPHAPLHTIFSELKVPLIDDPSHFNWKMPTANFSNDQIFYGAMISFGAIKMY